MNENLERLRTCLILANILYEQMKALAEKDEPFRNLWEESNWIEVLGEVGLCRTGLESFLSWGKAYGQS